MKREKIVTIAEPDSQISESYKILRSILSFFNGNEEKKVIMLTSAHDDDEKTAVITNAAVSLAQSGKRILLVEGDYRNPMLYDLFEVPKMPGLTNMVFEKKQLKDCVHDIIGIKGLSVLTAGTSPVANLELFARQEFLNAMEEMKTAYDMVLIDIPPVLKYSDGIVLSKYVDGVVLVAALGISNKEQLVQSRDMLKMVDAQILGLVLTNSKKKKKEQ
ncbi:CpsD/CapB family tyrosine-protein kinase [Petrocella sp. FN5]|uniref:CpsD/CapB family tyrosine-protein kinase n=1 Tax=Petrocella sp. FN5 TaxID=3032002 RepID=UPI0023D99777|nr:CpsD/CapB family tyrosine-protein kinase [Petrocella sp. FN5]MDF1617758.1 CpsD/CapB family tyrosine-protein kinase [Petrocella sp. FN5]